MFFMFRKFKRNNTSMHCRRKGVQPMVVIVSKLTGSLKNMKRQINRFLPKILPLEQVEKVSFHIVSGSIREPFLFYIYLLIFGYAG